MRAKLFALFVAVLFVLPSITIAAAIQADSGGAVNSFFGQNINLGTVGEDSIFKNKWVRGALEIGLGIKVDANTGKVTTSAFDIAMNLLVFVPVAGWAMRGAMISGRGMAAAGVRVAGRTIVKQSAGVAAKQAAKAGLRQGLRRFSMRTGLRVGKALQTAGNRLYRATSMLRKGKTVARTYFKIFDRTRRTAGKLVRSRLALDLGHKTAWLKSTKGFIPKVKNIINRLPHFNYKTTVSYLRGAARAGKTIPGNRHIPLATFVVGGRAISKAWSSFSSRFKSRSRSSTRYNNTRSIFRGNSTSRYRSSSRGSIFRSSPKRSIFKRSSSRSYSKRSYTKRSYSKRSSPKRSSSRSRSRSRSYCRSRR